MSLKSKIKKALSPFKIPYEIFHERKLLFNLSKNDFKTRFAGSYFGVFWAFVQPIVTVMVYWFVFEKGLKAGSQLTSSGLTVPFVLWLVAGIMPWFFFSEAVMGGANSLKEYSYLVKKVVFNIDILPVVKVFSAIFVHLFFILFMFVLFFAYGYVPTVYMVQVIYYSFCLICFVASLGYLTSALQVFFQDLTQVINIVLQVGIWVTPIMWNIDTIGLSATAVKLFKLNPLFYIVQGYRDAMINQVWFFEHGANTLYFWGLTIVIFLAGVNVFRRLKPHFADVL